MTEVLIVGNPNAGKTTLLNRLTGARLRTGNWQGVTVKPASVAAGEYTFTDIPGTFTLNYFSLEEKAAADYILAHRAAAFINAVDSFSVKRSLKFTAELVSLGIKPIVALTKLKAYSKRGKIDLAALERLTGCVVVSAEEITGESLPALLRRVEASRPRAFDVEKICLPAVGLSRVEKLLLKPAVNLLFFAAAFALTFYVAFGGGMVGETLKGLIFSAFSSLAQAVGGGISSNIVRGFICDCLIGGVGGVLSFLPQIAILYAALIALEDSGAMSYFAYMTDDIFSAVGLSGRAAFSVLLGFGCTSAAMCSARSFSNKRSAFTAAVALQYVPCSARLPVLITLLSSLFSNPFSAAALLYLLAVAFAVSAAYFCKGADEEAFFLELPVLRPPQLSTCLKVLLFQLKRFIIKVSGTMLAFVAAVWLLKTGAEALPSAARAVGGAIGLLFYPMGITDPRVVISVLSGLIAKENIAGTLNMFFPQGIELGGPSAVALSVFIMLSPPCVSAFSAACAETGKRAAAVSYLIQLAVGLAAAYAAYLILTRGIIFALIPLAVYFAAIATKGVLYERIHGKRKRNAKGLYG